MREGWHSLISHLSGTTTSKADLYKYVGIVLLTVQQASMPLMVRSTRDRAEERDVFLTTVNVFFMDLIKLGVCSLILIATEGSVRKFLRECRRAIIGDPLETAKICIPSLIYTAQNNLYYIALSNLESTTFCVSYQLKILTTALMLRFILKRPLSNTQWLALVVLIVGVANVQMQYEPPATRGGRSTDEQSPLLGFVAVFTMCCTSAFAGVYLEKVMKESDTSVWMQNVRLAVVGLPISLASMCLNDYSNIQQNGLLRGFDSLVWLMTFTNSAGGLLISVVIKYADNILKAYAQSAAIVGAAIGSWLLFDFMPNSLFLLGTALVIASIYLYTAYPARKHNVVGAASNAPK